MGAFLAVVLAAFLASSVEAVEALTIVLAAGYARGFKRALSGAAVAIFVLAIVLTFLGESLLKFVPIKIIRIFVGGYLLIFGLGWFKKAVLRAGGIKPLHNEEEIFQNELTRLKQNTESQTKLDFIKDPAFNTAFKGVFLEGIEIVLIVISLGSSTGKLLAVSLGAAIAILAVSLIGVIVKKALSKVPENAIKALVGIMLSSFGTFWAGQGLGVKWYLSDGFVVVLIALNALVFFGLVVMVKHLQVTGFFERQL